MGHIKKNEKLIGTAEAAIDIKCSDDIINI